MHSAVKQIPQRYVLTLLSFVAVVALYMMRVCLYISMTQMVKPIVQSKESLAQDEFSCPAAAEEDIVRPHGNSSLLTVIQDSEFEGLQQLDWNQDQQGIILSSFYMGYTLMQLPIGMIVERAGGKPVVLIALYFSAILSLLTPLSIQLGDLAGLFAVRFLLGCLQAGIFSAISRLLATWIPVGERGRIGGLLYCGPPLGTLLGNFSAGLLMHHYKSWTINFYVFGLVGIVSGILYNIFCTSSPSTNPFITEEEKAYLQKEIGQLERDKNLKTIPWRAIVTSTAVIALIIADAVGDWAYYVVLIDLPKYMHDVLHVSVKDNGILTAFPWAIYIAVSLASGYISDSLVSSGKLGVTNARKFLVTLASTVDGIFVFAAAYGGCDVSLIGTFFTVAVGAKGLLTSSIYLISVDLSPNYAGLLTGIYKTFSCFMGILVPLVISQLTPNSTQTEWRVVFWISIIANVIQIVVFGIWGSAEVQPWNEPPAQLAIDGKCVEMQLANGNKCSNVDNNSTTTIANERK